MGEGIHVAIRAGRLPDSNLVAKKIFSERVHLYASPSYLEAAGTPATIAELADHDCVVFTGAQHGPRWTLSDANGVETK